MNELAEKAKEGVRNLIEEIQILLDAKNILFPTTRLAVILNINASRMNAWIYKNGAGITPPPLFVKFLNDFSAALGDHEEEIIEGNLEKTLPILLNYVEIPYLEKKRRGTGKKTPRSPQSNCVQRVMNLFDLSPVLLSQVFDIKDRKVMDDLRACACKNIPDYIKEKAERLLAFKPDYEKKLMDMTPATRAQKLCDLVKDMLDIKDENEDKAETVETPVQTEIPVFLESGLLAGRGESTEYEICKALGLAGIVADRAEVPADEQMFTVISLDSDKIVKNIIPVLAGMINP